MNEENRIANILEEEKPAQQTPQETGPQAAGVAERFVALLIDGALVLFVYAWLLSFCKGPLFTTQAQMYWVVAGMSIPFILYMTVFSSGGRNTLGKKLVGIRVEDKATGQPLSMGRAFVRAVGYLVSGILLMCGFLLAFIDDKHRALHDFLARSVVVEARHKSWVERTALLVTGVILMTCFGMYLYTQMFGKGSFAQQNLISRAENHLKKIAYLEDVHYKHYGYYTNDLLRLSIMSGDPVQFQRDTHKVLSNKDFRIGVTKDGYKISARAKDKNQTKVYWPNW
ncbi:MAG: RDD family protein [Elusimicrobiaceae bacterium]|nr:RDD family protein [Elusimicrobiaceae bacterium]